MRIISLGMAVLAVLMMGLGASAQTDSAIPKGCIAIQNNDNLWSYDHNFKISDLANKNQHMHPPLDSPRRKFETAKGLDGIYLWPDKDYYICGVERVGSQLTPVTAEVAASAATPKTTPTSAARYFAEKLVGVLFLLIVLAVLVVWFVDWLLRRRNPAGTPDRRFAPEGIQPEQAQAYASETLAPQVYPGRRFTILSQTRQRARGAVISRYRNPTSERTVVLDGGPDSYVYRTRIRFTDTGEEVEMPFLQACGNPILYGTLAAWLPGLDFRYLGEPEVVPEPPIVGAQPVSEPPAPELPAQALSKMPQIMLTGLHLPEQTDGPSFSMWRMGDVVGLEFVKGNTQFILTVSAETVRYDGGRFTFNSPDLPPGMSIPVPPEVIAAAAVRQLNAVEENSEAAVGLSETSMAKV